MPRRMRGISPVIATVIILAVTIAIAIAVVGWVMGLFRSSTKSSAQLQILPDSYINSTGKALCLHVANKGSTSAKIVKIEISGLGVYTNSTGVVLSAGSDAWLYIGTGTPTEICKNAGTTNLTPFDKNDDIENAVPSVTYDVTVYTADGSTFPGQATAS